MASDLSKIVAAYLEAGRGRRLWRRIRRRHSFRREDLLMLMPASSPDLERAAVDYLPAYLRRKRPGLVVVVTASDAVARHVGSITDELPSGITCRVEQRPERDVLALCRFHRFVVFTLNVVVISTEELFAEPGLLRAENFGPRQMVETYLMGW